MTAAEIEIHSMDSDGAGVTQLTNHPAEDREPVWSPDGTRVAFVTDRDGNYDIFIMGADGSDSVNLTRQRNFDDEPIWSPDGSKIAWRANRTDDAEIFVMEAAGPIQPGHRPSRRAPPAPWSGPEE